MMVITLSSYEIHRECLGLIHLAQSSCLKFCYHFHKYSIHSNLLEIILLFLLWCSNKLWRKHNPLGLSGHYTTIMPFPSMHYQNHTNWSVANSFFPFLKKIPIISKHFSRFPMVQPNISIKCRGCLYFNMSMAFS